MRKCFFEIYFGVIDNLFIMVFISKVEYCDSFDNIIFFISKLIND